MKQALAVIVAAGLAIALTGCGKPTPESVIEDMTEAMKEMTETLKTIKNAESAKAAVDKLQKQAEQLEDLGTQAEALDADMTAEERAELSQALENSEFPSVAMGFMMEMMRVGQIPGVQEELEAVMDTIEDSMPN